MTQRKGRVRAANPNLDRQVLLTYLSLLVLVLFGAAVWTTLALSRSSAVVGGVIAVVAVIYGVTIGRLRKGWFRWLGMASVLVILILFAGSAGVGIRTNLLGCSRQLPDSFWLAQNGRGGEEVMKRNRRLAEE